MIDILLSSWCSSSKIIKLLSEIFDCTADRVLVFSCDEFNSLTEELDDSQFDCVCVFFPVQGDVSQLWQLYKYKLANSVIFERIVLIAKMTGVLFYIPSESLNTWSCVRGDSIKLVRQVESDEESCFTFEMT